jgi:hypothetical protein
VKDVWDCCFGTHIGNHFRIPQDDPLTLIVETFMRLGCILNGFGDCDEGKALVEGIEAGDDLEIGNELMEVERGGAVDAADVE